MEIDHKDKKEEIEFLRMACNIAGINLNYTQVDLILRLQERVTKLKEEFSLADGAEIHQNWQLEWQKYFKDRYTKET